MNEVKKSSFKVTGDLESATRIYVDGTLGVMMGAAVSKINFHQVVGTDAETNEEIRKVMLSLSMPTAAMVEFCAQVLANLSANRQLMENAMDETKTKTFSFVPPQS